MVIWRHRAGRENIHTPPTEGIGISWGVGSSVRPKKLKKCMKFNWNFQRGGVGWGGGNLRKKSLLWGRYDYFLEPHIANYFKFLDFKKNLKVEL